MQARYIRWPCLTTAQGCQLSRLVLLWGCLASNKASHAVHQHCCEQSNHHAYCLLVELLLSGLQVCAAIKPESAETVYLMLLDKSPTQEEFIRGHLTNNPYNSAEVGPLMRDVKNFICRELDMEGKSCHAHSDLYQGQHPQLKPEIGM